MCESLASVCAALESGAGVPPDVLDRLWRLWLWDTPCNAPLSEQCGDMNHNQGVGVLLCVALSYEEPGEALTIEQLLPHSPLVHITTPPLAELTQRQLSDQLECLQLYWGQVVATHEVSTSPPPSYSIVFSISRL